MGECSKRTFFRKENIITIPNVISLFRLMLIPAFSWCYIKAQNYKATIAVIALSGLSDIADGKIARRYNMVSDFGKIFDPIVDKLTQAAMIFCLLHRFPNMMILLVIHVIKEITTGVISLLAIYKTNVVEPAEWPGKLTTVFLYATAMIHILWVGITEEISNIMIGACIGWMLFAFVYYSLRNLRALRGKQKRSHRKEMKKITYTEESKS